MKSSPWFGAVWFMIGSSLGAAEASQDVAAMQAQIDLIREQYEERIRSLERRVQELESERARPPASEPADELADLRAAAAAAAAGPTPAEAAEGSPATGRERNLNQLNPEISFTGDVLTLAESGAQDFESREFELDFQAVLDPFSSTKWTLAYSPEEGVEIEEGYIRYAGLAPGLELRLGKMRQTFGALNRTHLHALPQVDYPLVLTTFFDEEGLAQTGVSATWLLPRGWASANELTVQVTDGSAAPFGGEELEALVALGHLKNYWDLSASTYLEWGLSGAVGRPEPGRDSSIWGTDLTVHWQPPGRAKYRELTWRSEILLSRRDDELGLEREAVGGYTYLEGLARRNLYAGLRYDWVEDPIDPTARVWGIEPYVSWWQSEYVRLRAAYQYLRDEASDQGDGRFTLQLTWAAGPHKHESY